MSITIVLLIFGCIIMVATIAYGLIAGDFRGEARLLLSHPWFHVSMIDLYAGFFLFSGWIAFRERSRLVAAIWIVLLLTLGNLVSCLYAVIAAIRAQGDWQAFWLGSRAARGGHRDHHP